MYHKNPEQDQIGKLLSWTIINSYFLHWTGGSTFELLDKAMKLLSEKNVDWNSLYSELKISKKYVPKDPTKISLSFDDLTPSFDLTWLGEFNLSTTKSKGHPFQNLIRCTIPRFYNLEDWRTGDTFEKLDFNQPTIHHIFPQSKFKAFQFETNMAEAFNLNENNSSFRSVVERWDKKISIIGQNVEKTLETSINEVSEQISEIEIFLKEATSNNSLAKKKRELASAKNRLEKYQKSLKNLNKESKESILKEVNNATEWWFQFGPDKKRLYDRVGNIAYLVGPTNSSLGSEWPEKSLERYMITYQERLLNYSLPVNEKKLLLRSNFDMFCENREGKLLSRVKNMLSQFNDGIFKAPITNAPEVDVFEKMLNDKTEQYIERKETMLFDVNLKKPAPKNNYLLSSIVRAAVSWANTAGGEVLIGVDDVGNVVGLERDFEILEEKYPTKTPDDKWHQILTEALEQTKPSFTFDIEYPEFEGKKCCRIIVKGDLNEVQQLSYIKVGEKKRKAYWERIPKGSREYVLTRDKQRVRRPPKGKLAESTNDEGIEFLSFDEYEWMRKENSKSQWNLAND